MSKRLKNIVCLGGGTGTSMVLSGLKKYPLDLTAVVTMFDNGGSSGKLRKELGVLPFGDIRQCLVSLARKSSLIDFFNYRFKTGALKGHNLGNLLITAASQTGENIEKGIDKIGSILDVKGKVLPVTLENTNIMAVLKNNQKISGEDNIVKFRYLSKIGIKKLFLEPKVKVNPGVISAIKKADLIIIGPGKFYTSIISNFLIKEVPQAIKKARAKKVFVCNLMTQTGNTDNFKAEDFIKILEKYLGRKTIDYVVFNIGKLSKEQLKEVKKVFPGANFIKYDESLLKKKNFIGADLLDKNIRKLNSADSLVEGANRRTMILHNSVKLAKIILSLI
jgi:uncharacterized cofD-like protein